MNTNSETTLEQQEILVEIMKTAQHLKDITPNLVNALKAELEQTERELEELRTPWYTKLWRRLLNS